PGPNWDWPRFMALVAQYAAAAPAGPGPAPAPPQPADPTLMQGDQGTAVASAQSLLNIGRGRAGDALLAVDGSFGPEMLAAVELFQQQEGLAVTGLVDQGTWDALRLQ
ncbi:MAG: peptidoglycan-binding domain-containing protein, partial [Polyangiaceae bacterium]